MNQDIVAKIQQRRKQMILHSIIYYRFGDGIVSDKTFDKWAYELKDLQKHYPEESKKVVHYELFKDWDGSTGYHLIDMVEYLPKAEWMLDYERG